MTLEEWGAIHGEIITIEEKPIKYRTEEENKKLEGLYEEYNKYKVKDFFK